MLSPRRFPLVLIALGGFVATGVLACGSDATDPGATATATDTAAVSIIGSGSESAGGTYFELSGGDIRVTYGPVAGASTFTYEDKWQTKTFTGSEINSTLTPAGTMVTVPIRESIETGFASFSILIPRVVLGPNASEPIQTPGITTTHMVPARLALGQLDQYVVTPLQGTMHILVPPKVVEGPRLPAPRFYY